MGDGWEVIELDALRLEVTGKAGSQAENGKVFQLAKERLREVLRRKGKVVWDATNLREDGRAMILGLAHDYHAATRLMGFAVPPGEALRRDRGRARMVGEKVIGWQFERMMWPNLWEAHRVEWVRG